MRHHVGSDFWCHCGAMIRGGWSCIVGGPGSDKCHATTRKGERRTIPCAQITGIVRMSGKYYVCQRHGDRRKS